MARGPVGEPSPIDNFPLVQGFRLLAEASSTERSESEPSVPMLY